MVLLFGGLVGPDLPGGLLRTRPDGAAPQLDVLVGLFITAVDVLAALALTNAGAKAAARHNELTRQGILVPARITGMSDTAWFVNDQQMIKVNLHVDVPGQPGFDVQETMASSPTRMRILNAHTWSHWWSRAHRTMRSTGMQALWFPASSRPVHHRRGSPDL